MIAQDMKKFNKYYGTFIVSLLQLKDGPIHEKIMGDVLKFMDDGQDRLKAIRMALHKRRYLFDTLWDFDRYDDDDNDTTTENTEDE